MGRRSCYLTEKEFALIFLTSLSFLAHGFWAFLNPSSASLASLKPPIICLWYASFCQFFTFSTSSLTRLFFTSWCSSLTLSASVITASQALSTEPYCGPASWIILWFQVKFQGNITQWNREKHIEIKGHMVKDSSTFAPSYLVDTLTKADLSQWAVSISWTRQLVDHHRLSLSWHVPASSS